MSAQAIGEIISRQWGADAQNRLAQQQQQQQYIERWMGVLAGVMTDGMHRDLEIIGTGGRDKDELLISFSNQSVMFLWSRDPALRDRCHQALSRDTPWFFKKFVKLTAQMRMPAPDGQVFDTFSAAPSPVAEKPSGLPEGYTSASPYKTHRPSPKPKLTPQRVQAGDAGLAALRAALSGVKKK